MRLTLVGLIGFAILLAACTAVEGTGRKQLLVTSPAEENAQGDAAYREVLAQEKRSTDAEATALMTRVGQRLAAVAPARGFSYEFTLLESPTVNAFCLPGGKVAVYSGILPYCQNEAGLAAVMGHEIGHAIARHGGERMRDGLLLGGGMAALEAVLNANHIEASESNLILAAAGGLTQVGYVLRFSREQELEADWLGLQYMAKAGYDPHEAVAFWGRFAQLTKHGPPKFLSTHPPSDERAETLTTHMDEAQRMYLAATQRLGAGALVPARYRAVP